MKAQTVTAEAYRYERLNIKTNILYDLAAGLNLGVETPLSSRLSIDLSGVYNPFTFSDGVKWKNWLVQPELRWWTRRALNGHFLAAHLVAGEYNLNRVTLLYNAFPETRTHRFEGWGIGGGIGYGYRWTFNRRWAMEAEIAAGVIYSKYDKYRCGRCGERISRGSKVYAGPTKLALSLLYRFGTKDTEEPAALIAGPATVRDTVLLHDTLYIERIVEKPAERPADASLRLRKASMSLRVTFPHDGAAIDPLLGDNAVQIDSLSRFIVRYADDPSLRVNRIEINAYASLEGSAEHNLHLSEQRAEAGTALIKDMRPDLAPLIVSRGMGEDWDSPEFPGKERLLAEPDLDRREEILRSMADGAVMRSLAVTQLPRHRRLEAVIFFSLIEPGTNH
ncbi:MAG: DUF3575 domain-containing protein [bacterium]|nr:DUF3575 domain-containing protein [bacterium]